MCYSPVMERIAVRELRNHASQVVRRARAGERMIITVDGVPVAEIGPIRSADRSGTFEELVATGAIIAARRRSTAPPARPVPAPAGRTSSKVLRELRDR